MLRGSDSRTLLGTDQGAVPLADLQRDEPLVVCVAANGWFFRSVPGQIQEDGGIIGSNRGRFAVLPSPEERPWECRQIQGTK